MTKADQFATELDEKMSAAAVECVTQEDKLRTVSTIIEGFFHNLYRNALSQN